MDFQKFIPLDLQKGVVEQPDGTLYVYGLVTAEKPDLEKQVCDYETTKPLYIEKANWQLNASSVPGMEPSLMPHREMHTLKAIGKGVKLDFDDAAKTISMGFQVVDPDAIQKYKKGVFIGFSQGGDYVGALRPDPVFKGCERYTARPGEVSAVDSPCLPDALVETMKGKTFPLTKSNGSIELVKLDTTGKLAKKVQTAFDVSNMEEPKLNGVTYEKCAPEESTLTIGESHYKVKAVAKSSAEEIAEATVAAMIKSGVFTLNTGTNSASSVLAKEDKTKRVGGKDLHASDFAHVGDPQDTSTWKLPIHDKAHAQNALARFNQTEGIPDDKKAEVKAKIVAAAKKHGIEVSEEATKACELFSFYATDPGRCEKILGAMHAFGGDVQKTEALVKGFYDIQDITGVLTTLAFVHSCLVDERAWEADTSVVPEHLRTVIEDLVQVYVELVEEETKELITAMGGKEAAMTTDLQKAAAQMKKAAEHANAALQMCKAHHEARVAMHKGHHDMMQKAAPHLSAVHKAHMDACDGLSKSHCDEMSGMVKSFASEISADGEGPDSTTVTNNGEAHSNAKAATLEEIGALIDSKLTKFKSDIDAAQDENTTALLKTVFALADGGNVDPAPGVGDRGATVTKVHATQPVKKDADMNNTGGNGGASQQQEVVTATPAMAKAAIISGDLKSMLQLTKTIKNAGSNVPASIQQRMTQR